MVKAGQKSAKKEAVNGENELPSEPTKPTKASNPVEGEPKTLESQNNPILRVRRQRAQCLVTETV